MNTEAPDLGLRSRLERIVDSRLRYIGTPHPLRLGNLYRDVKLALSESTPAEVAPGLAVGGCARCSSPILVARSDPRNTMGMTCSVCAYRAGVRDGVAKVSG